MSRVADTWVTAPLNQGTGMPLGPRSFGYHDAPGQTQRRIGGHVYIAQRYPDRIDMWRLERVGGALDCHCWRLVHRWTTVGAVS